MQCRAAAVVSYFPMTHGQREFEFLAALFLHLFLGIHKWYWRCSNGEGLESVPLCRVFEFVVIITVVILVCFGCWALGFQF